MSAAWAEVAVAAAVAAGAALGAVWRSGRRDGKIDTAIEHLTAIVQDHEARLRIVEQIRAPGRRIR